MVPLEYLMDRPIVASLRGMVDPNEGMSRRK